MAVSTTSLTRIVLIGWLWVNLPVTMIIIVVWLGALQLKVPYVPALLIGTATGWGYWTWSIRSWIRWAHGKGATRVQLVRAGRNAFLHWGESTVEKALGHA